MGRGRGGSETEEKYSGKGYWLGSTVGQKTIFPIKKKKREGGKEGRN